MAEDDAHGGPGNEAVFVSPKPAFVRKPHRPGFESSPNGPLRRIKQTRDALAKNVLSTRVPRVGCARDSSYVGDEVMAINSNVSRANQRTLAHLRTLRLNLDQARTALMHYKDDRIDRDKLEPAARRVDDLMNLFATGAQEPAQGLAWMTEIRAVIDGVPNPKSTAALQAAGVEIDALVALMTPEQGSRTGGALSS
jgi:hypothetical protein